MIATEPISAPIEVVTPIKPSEAIRLGCLIAPVQAFGHYFDRDATRPTACALGAMNLGFGAPVNGDPRPGDPRWPVRTMTIVDGCPTGERCGYVGTSANTIPHLNDDHRWSRERIADWLEGLGL